MASGSGHIKKTNQREKERGGKTEGNKPKQRRARQQHRKSNENGKRDTDGKEIEMWLGMGKI